MPIVAASVLLTFTLVLCGCRLTQEGVDASRLGVRPEPVAAPERGRRAPAAQIYLQITQVVSPTAR